MSADPRFPAAGTRPPLPVEIVLEITGQCRLSCAYCTHPDGRASHAALAGVLETLNAMAALGIPAVRFTGGEPLLHPRLREMLVRAKALKLYTIVNTSAEELSAARLRTLAATTDAVLVSLQGHSAASSRRYTGSRVPFRQKLANIFALKALVPVLRVGTVITPDLEKDFERYAALVRRMAPASWGLFRAVAPAGNDDRRMDNAFFRRLVRRILRARQQGLPVTIANAAPLCAAGDLRAGQEAMGGALFDDGHCRLVRGPLGDFRPSYFLNQSLGRTIPEAWAHPFLRELDRLDRLPDLCQRCPALAVCQGGCRAVSLRARGDIHAPDPLFSPAMAAKAQQALHRALSVR